MADTPPQLSDQPQQLAINDSADKDTLADYRTASLNAKDAPAPAKQADSLPAMAIEPHLEHDAKGRLTSVQRADGSVTQCKYDEIGCLSAVSTKDGGWWVHKGYNQWDYIDKSGRDTGKQIAGVMVDEDKGNVEYFSNLQPQAGKTTRYSDIDYANGAHASMDWNANGTKTEKVTFANGDTQTVHYDKDGKPDVVANGYKNGRERGCSWVKQGDIWTQYDDSGDATGNTKPKGTWASCGASLLGGEVSWFHYPAGVSSDTVNIDGEMVRHDDSNRLTQVTDLQGRSETFEYAPDGHVTSMTNRDGATWKSVNGEFKKVEKNGELSDAPVTGFMSIGSCEGGDVSFQQKYR